MSEDFKTFIERVKTAVRIEQVIADTGRLTIFRRGKYLSTKEHSSLSIDAERGWYEWYSKGNSPGARGDVITWLQHWGGFPEFGDALRYLSEKTGIHYEWNERQTKAYQTQQTRFNTLTVMAGYLHRRFLATASAVSYARSRGWTEETLKAAKLGYWHWDDAEGLRGELQMHEISLERPEVVAVLGYRGDVAAWAERWGIERSRLEVKWIRSGHIPGMPGGMLVYLHWQRGQCVYLSARAIQEKSHWNMRSLFVGERQPYYNHAYIYHAEYVVVVEGQADAISLAQWNLPAVALAGLKANDGLIESLRRHKTFVALDADMAGERGARLLAETMGPATLIVTWPGGGDANDWLQQGGSEQKCRELLATASIYALYMARRWRKVPEVERETAKRYVYELIASLMPYDYANAAPVLAETMGLRLADLNRLVRAIKVERDLAAQGVEEARPVKDALTRSRPSVGQGPKLDAELEEFLISEARDHEGHAQAVKRLHGDKIAYVPEWGWLVYNGQYWSTEGASHHVEELVVDTLKTRRHLAVDRELEALVAATVCSRHNVLSTQAQLERMVLARVGDFDANPDLLNCNNGVVELRTGELVAHSPEQRFTYCLATDYVPKADYSDWIIFLGQVTGIRDKNDIWFVDREVIDWLQMAIGYSLTGRTSEGCIFYLYGPTRSGKGTFTQTLLRLLGKPLGGSVDFNVLVQQRNEDSQNFALAPLKACRLLVGNEPGKYERFNDAKLKLLTGEDPVRCSLKHRDSFEYQPQYKIWLSSNWPFNADTSDDAAWGRARIIHFPNSFLGQEDKGLKERLQSDECLQGLLAWAVDGARAWYASEGGLRTPQAIVSTIKEQRLDQDFVQQFIDDCCERQPEVFTSTADLYNAYVGWCQGVVTPQKLRSFSLTLKGKGFRDGRGRIKEGPQQRTLFGETGEMPTKVQQLRGFYGIRLGEEGRSWLDVKAGKRRDL